MAAALQRRIRGTQTSSPSRQPMDVRARRMALAEERDLKLHDLPFWRKYIFSTDHKVIGLQYGFTALCFLLLGFSLMILMRLQLGWPGHAFSIMKIIGEGRAPGGVLLPEAYNQLGAMHGTIMIFLGIVPL